MRVFVTGATGTVGTAPRSPARRARARRHRPRALARAARLAALGGEPVVLNELDSTAVGEAVRAARPDAIVHEATALGGASDVKHFDRASDDEPPPHRGHRCAPRGGRRVRRGRFVAQSYPGWPYARDGGAVRADDPLDPDPCRDAW